jgi:hypothetical protein
MPAGGLMYVHGCALGGRLPSDEQKSGKESGCEPDYRWGDYLCLRFCHEPFYIL